MKLAMQKTQYTISDATNVELTDRALQLKDLQASTMPEICIERPALLTHYYYQHNYFGADHLSGLQRAKAFRYILENRKPIISHPKARALDGSLVDLSQAPLSLFAGTCSSKNKGVLLYPEFLALALWPELKNLPQRQREAYYISPKDIVSLNTDIFPKWVNDNLPELTRLKHGIDVTSQMLGQLGNFFISKLYCVSHTIPDFSLVISQGLDGISKQAEQQRMNANNQDQADFYAAVQQVVYGISKFSSNIARQAHTEAFLQSNPSRKKELLTLAEIHRRVPQKPARTFREGLTTIWIVLTAILIENSNTGISLGRLDQILVDLYLKDLAEGRLTREQAVELIACFWLKLGDHIPSIPTVAGSFFGATGSNQAVTIGGVDPDGNDAVNELTYIILRATELLKLRDPNLNARYFSKVNSPRYLERLCEVNISTGSTPAIHNDKQVILALTDKGDTHRQALDYGIVGCVEPASSGRTYGHSASIILNLVAVLEATLNKSKLNECRCFDEFEAAFIDKLRTTINQAVDLNNFMGKIHQNHLPSPIFSTFFEGPLTKGKDLIFGGAMINASGVAIVGFADVVDSLCAIEHHVFDKQTITFTELLQSVANNFDNKVPLQKMLQNPRRTPKFGDESTISSKTSTKLVQLLDELFSSRSTYRGGHHRVGYWSMTTHAAWGKHSGALPSGRGANQSFASGIAPVTSAAPELTATLGAVANLPSKNLSGGIALNLRYEPETRAGMAAEMAASIEGYFDDNYGKGGMEVQFNVIDQEQLLDAIEHPESYPDLLVRVSGYTAFFRDLPPEMQSEIASRSRYSLLTGRAITNEKP